MCKHDDVVLASYSKVCSCCVGGEGAAKEATLILRELDAAEAERLDSTGAAELAACDLAVFVFDSTDAGSFGDAMRLLHRVTRAANDTLPCVLVAAKEDLGMAAVSHPCA